MKTAILLILVFFMSITLSAQDAPKAREYVLGFTNIETAYKEVVPALSVEVKSKSSNGFDFYIAYVSDLFNEKILEKQTEVKNPQLQNMYVAMNYKF